MCAHVLEKKKPIVMNIFLTVWTVCMTGGILWMEENCIVYEHLWTVPESFLTRCYVVKNTNCGCVGWKESVFILSFIDHWTRPRDARVHDK